MEITIDEIGAMPETREHRDKVFYLCVSITSAVVVFLGFSKSYYLRGYFGSPELPLLFAVHGFVFSCWVVYFVAQAWLALDGRFRLHRHMGIAGAFLASAMIILGVGVTFASARVGHFAQIPGATNASEACLFSLFDIGLFGLFVWAGFLWRFKPAIHQRLMVLGMVVPLLPSAIGRLCNHRTALAVPLITAFMLSGPIYDYLSRRKVHKAYLFGLAVVVVTQPPIRILLARTAAWHWAYRWLVG